MQSGGCLLAGVNFATDYGDTHISLDMVKDATIRAHDMRLRFELFNVPESWQPGEWQVAQVKPLDLGGVHMELLVPYAAFDGQPVRTEVGREGDNAFLDLVLYRGQERSFELAAMSDAAILFGLRLRDKAESSDPTPDIRWEAVQDRLRAMWPLASAPLSLELYRQPGPVSRLHSIAPVYGV